MFFIDDDKIEYWTYRNTARMVRQQAKTNAYLDEMRTEKHIQEKLKDILTRHMLMMDLIDGVKDPLLQCHLYISLFYGRDEDFDVLVSELESMDDRKEAMAQQARLKALDERLTVHQKQYVESPLKRLFDEIKSYLKEKEAPNKLPYIPTPIVFRPKAPIHPAVYEVGIALAAIVGILGTGLFLLVAGTNYQDPALVIIGVGIGVFIAVVSVVSLILLTKGLKKAKAIRNLPVKMTEDEKKYLEAKQRQNAQKKEMEKALANHGIYRHIQLLKETYPEYVPTWERIKKLETRLNDTPGSEAHKFIRR